MNIIILDDFDSNILRIVLPSVLKLSGSVKANIIPIRPEPDPKLCIIWFRWDAKSKKYVRVQDDKKRIKTESGVYISATYKTNRFDRVGIEGLRI